MNCPQRVLICLLTLTGCLMACPARAADLTSVGTQYDIGGTFYPGGSLPYVTVPWRTSSANNIYAIDDTYPEQYYGHDGYALFATNFTYPDAGQLGGTAIDPVAGDVLFPNIIDLPTWVADSQILSTLMAGGYAYALIDDPVLQHGVRHWSFYAEGDIINGYTKYYPPADGTNNTGQNPYVQLGVLTGSDLQGHNLQVEPTGRWAFTVGPDAPGAFRVGVMTGGTDNSLYSPTEVFLQQYDGLTPVGNPLSTGALAQNRFVDMHFFDIVGAQEGDSFVFAVMNTNAHIAGIAGFSFDVLPAPNADFDGSGVVAGNDFLIWQRGNGLTGATQAQGDANGDTHVDGADLGVWSEQFGSAPPGVVAISQVPEPGALLLVVAGLLGACGGRRSP